MPEHRAVVQEDPVTGVLRVAYLDIEICGFMYPDNAHRACSRINEVVALARAEGQSEP